MYYIKTLLDQAEAIQTCFLQSMHVSMTSEIQLLYQSIDLIYKYLNTFIYFFLIDVEQGF